MPLCGGNKVVQRKLVLLGDGACGKTSLLNVFTRGFFPVRLPRTPAFAFRTCFANTIDNSQTVYEPTVFENYVHDIFVDGIHMELSLWDTAGQEEFDRLRSLSYDDTQAIMLCFSVRFQTRLCSTRHRRGEPNVKLMCAAQVDNRGSLENVGTKWIAEINEHCPGVKIVLCALKCDLREEHEKEDGEPHAPPRPMIQYNEGLEVARQIGALRYLGMFGHGSTCLFTSFARIKLTVV